MGKGVFAFSLFYSKLCVCVCVCACVCVIYFTIKHLKPWSWGFPGGQVVKNPPARGHRFDSWSGKIPHAVCQLSPCCRTTEPVFWAQELQLLSPNAETTEAHAPRSWCYIAREASATRGPRTATREEPPLSTTREAQTKRRHNAAKINTDF